MEKVLSVCLLLGAGDILGCCTGACAGGWAVGAGVGGGSGVL